MQLCNCQVASPSCANYNNYTLFILFFSGQKLVPVTRGRHERFCFCAGFLGHYNCISFSVNIDSHFVTVGDCDGPDGSFTTTANFANRKAFLPKFPFVNPPFFMSV